MHSELIAHIELTLALQSLAMPHLLYRNEKYHTIHTNIHTTVCYKIALHKDL